MRTLLPNAQRLARPARLGLQSLVPALCNAQVWGQDRYLPRNRVRAKKALMDQHQCRSSSGTPAASFWNWEADVGQSMAAALRAAKTSSGRLSAEVLQHICAPAFSTSHSGCTSQGTASPISLWPTAWKQKLGGSCYKRGLQRRAATISEHSLQVFLWDGNHPNHIELLKCLALKQSEIIFFGVLLTQHPWMPHL